MPSSSPLTHVSTVCVVFHFVRISTINDILKLAHISSTFGDALESYSATVWRRIATSLESQSSCESESSREYDSTSSLDSSALIAAFAHSEFAWIAYNMLTVGELHVSRLEKHPLYLAVEEGAADVVRVCIAADPSCLDVRNDDGLTALQIASFFGNADCVRELLAAGADIAIATSHGGCTALHCAVEGGNAAVVRIFITHRQFDKIRDVRQTRRQDGVGSRRN